MGSSHDPVPVAVALGSNLGDREAHLGAAVDALAALLTGLRVSDFHDTEPVGVGQQPRFLNAVVTGTTTIGASELLRELLAIEARLGRTRPFAGAPRTVDLDLILYGRSIVDTSTLKVPHPRFREREFVLSPLAQVAGDWVDPVSGCTIAELLRLLPRHGEASS